MKPILGKHPNGQWYKKIKQRPYYFGAVKDVAYEAAVGEYNDRLPGIIAGTDHLRLLATGKEHSVGKLFAAYIAQRKIDVDAGILSLNTLGGIIREVSPFIAWIKQDTNVAALKPNHFASYVNELVKQGLRAHARKRVMAYIRTMFKWGPTAGFPLPEFGNAFKAPSTTKSALRKEKNRAGISDYSERIATGIEINKLIENAPANLKAMILVGVNCGLGPADMGRMQWKNVDLEHGVLNFPRPKNGNPRMGFLWKRTREALRRLLTLKHTKAGIEKNGENALVFMTKKNLPYYRELPVYRDVEVGGAKVRKLVGVKISCPIPSQFGRVAKECEIKNLSMYRLRHTFKTLAKKAKDTDALNLAMGHDPNTTESTYDHEEIEFKRIRRVAIAVKRGLWPKPKRRAGESPETPQMRYDASDDGTAQAA